MFKNSQILTSLFGKLVSLVAFVALGRKDWAERKEVVEEVCAVPFAAVAASVTVHAVCSFLFFYGLGIMKADAGTGLICMAAWPIFYFGWKFLCSIFTNSVVAVGILDDTAIASTKAVREKTADAASAVAEKLRGTSEQSPETA